MEKQQTKNTWETVVIPTDAITKEYKSKNTGHELVEIGLPDELPAGAPKCEGWRFYMPATCVEKTGKSAALKFPPSWKTLRFLSPFVKGQRTKSLEYPMDAGLEMLREAFKNQ